MDLREVLGKRARAARMDEYCLLVLIEGQRILNN
jgi:hypothetical protein